MDLFDSLKFKIIRRNIKVAFPEATDARILGAASRLKAEELIEPILIGNLAEIEKAAGARGIALENFTIIDPDHFDRWMKWLKPLLNVVKEKSAKKMRKRFLKMKTTSVQC